MIFDISGTRLGLSTADPAWSAVFTFPRAHMHFSESMKIDAAVRLQMQDTRPLVVMFDALRGIPKPLERMLMIQDIHGSTSLDGSRGKVVLRDLDVTGKGLHALADLELGKGSKEGILYVRFHGFSLGVELKEGTRDLKVFRPLHWFQDQREHRRLQTPSEALAEHQPPAIAPTTKKGSLPDSTSPGSGASGDSWERSCSQAKKRMNGRRFFVTWSRIVPFSIG
jgi:hypothetical protein